METLDLSVQKSKVAKPMLYVGMVSIVMLFAGLTSAYIVRQAEGNWLVFPFPSAFFISTCFILLSSFTMVLAVKAIKKGNHQQLSQMLAATLFLGLGFGVAQLVGWNELIDNNVFFTGPTANASGSFMYVLTGMHLAHFVAGIIALTYTWFKAKRARYSATNYLGVELTGIYWHFLDLLWIYLLLFLYFIR